MQENAICAVAPNMRAGIVRQVCAIDVDMRDISMSIGRNKEG